MSRRLLSIIKFQFGKRILGELISLVTRTSIFRISASLSKNILPNLSALFEEKSGEFSTCRSDNL